MEALERSTTGEGRERTKSSGRNLPDMEAAGASKNDDEVYSPPPSPFSSQAFRPPPSSEDYAPPEFQAFSLPPSSQESIPPVLFGNTQDMPKPTSNTSIMRQSPMEIEPIDPTSSFRLMSLVDKE